MLFKRLQILCEDRPDVTVELLAGELSYSIFGFFSFSLDEGFVVAEKDSGKAGVFGRRRRARIERRHPETWVRHTRFRYRCTDCHLEFT